MRTIRTVAELRAALLAPRRSGLQIGLVPTMGAFHDGHLSLIRHARVHCDVVVVSLFVNPAQFDDQGDLDRLPARRGRGRDAGSGTGRRHPLRPSVPGGLSRRVRHHGLGGRADRDA